MANLQDCCNSSLVTQLVMSCCCGSVLHCICHRFIKLPPVVWHHQVDSSSQTPEQTSMGCSTETAEAKTNNRVTKFQLVPMNNHACTCIHFCTESWFVKHFVTSITYTVYSLIVLMMGSKGQIFLTLLVVLLQLFVVIWIPWITSIYSGQCIKLLSRRLKGDWLKRHNGGVPNSRCVFQSKNDEKWR